MRNRRLDENGDVMFGYGLASLSIDEPETVKLAVLTRLHLGAGEWFLNTDDGTPWATKVLGKYTQSTRDPVVRGRIFDTPGVQAMRQYGSTFDTATRNYVVQATIDTIYGTTTIAGPI